MDIPDALRTNIREGRAVLVLGAGASRDAADSQGNRPPNAAELAAKLSDRFLGGMYKDYSLAQIAELAMSETDLTTVQEYVREIFIAFEPSSAHLAMTSFVWAGLATTNYDLLIERAYERSESPQKPKPFIENGDRVDEAMRQIEAVKLLKLHGCITRTTNRDCPLILTPDQYIQYSKGRSRVFTQLTDWGFELPIVFVGHSLQDADIRAVILQLTEECGASRPRYYAVSPDVDDAHSRLWSQKRITLLRGTFKEFIGTLNDQIPREFRRLAVVTNKLDVPVAQRFKRADWTLSPSCQQFLESDVDYVKAVNAVETLSPKDFYKGINPGWSAIEQGLDVPRQLEETILVDHFLADEADHLGRMELVLVKAHAGAGKSVFLRRIAWDAAHDYDCLCLFMRPNGLIHAPAIQELIELCGERVYLFVDDAAERARELQDLASSIGSAGSKLTVLIAERINEWNVACAEISDLVTSDYELRYLKPPEISGLLQLLEKHRALGTLEALSSSEREKALAQRAGRQLLVALHEATLGRKFEDILEDEYRSIVPAEAQRMYLSICVLNRFNVRVRAGIISRMHGIAFEEFKRRLFAPLEHVVQARRDDILRDYVYEARHPHIAEIVFQCILRDPGEKYDAYIRCLKALNVDYSDDRQAYRQMIRGRNLLKLFPNNEMVQSIYEVASQAIGEDSYLLHQMAIYEMHRPGGSLYQSGEWLNKAAKLAPHDFSIEHSMAERYLKAADMARTDLEKEQFLTKADEVARHLRSWRRDDSHGYHTLIKIGLARFRSLLSLPESTSSQQELADVAKDIEQHLTDATQRFPDESYILEAEAQFAGMTQDAPRVLTALQKAFDVNPRSTYLAIRLAKCYRQRDNLDEARQTLNKALEANGNETRLHYAYAKLLMEMGEEDGNLLAYHLQRAYIVGDDNYDAQLLYGRQLFINGDREGWRNVFRALKNARAGNLHNTCRYLVKNKEHGYIDRKEAAYCWIARDGDKEWIFLSAADIDADIWDQLAPGIRVTFSIGFALRGPRACDVQLER